VKQIEAYWVVCGDSRKAVTAHREEWLRFATQRSADRWLSMRRERGFWVVGLTYVGEPELHIRATAIRMNANGPDLTYDRVVCVHCRAVKHQTDGKCLYAPTQFRCVLAEYDQWIESAPFATHRLVDRRYV
jgi:hypothetical protein